jgi:hypothetical protein
MGFQDLKIRFHIKGTSTINDLGVCQRKFIANPTTDGVIKDPGDKWTLSRTQGLDIGRKIARADGQKNRTTIGSTECDSSGMVRNQFNTLVHSGDTSLEANEWNSACNAGRANGLMGRSGEGVTSINDSPDVFLTKKILQTLSVQPA